MRFKRCTRWLEPAEARKDSKENMKKKGIAQAFSPEHSDYRKFILSIRELIDKARFRVFKIASNTQVLLYWTIGEGIVQLQDKHGWGDAVVENLARDLKKSIPDAVSFSARNLWLMRQLYIEYRGLAEKLKQLVSEIPWGQNILVMQKVTSIDERKYYLNAVREMGWSRNVLLNQIKGKAYQRHVTKTKQHNFEKALPVHLSEQADKAMKDVYMLDFLGITHPVLEREFEKRMIACMRDVLLEFGTGFAFIGSQYTLSTKTKDYRVDLLFYQRKLRCLVAVDLKSGAFEPEFAGKMNFYLNLLDDTVREPDENPSIGIILCAGKDRFDVEYALRGINKPMGVAEYQLTRILPESLKGSLPNPSQIRKRLMKEFTKQ
jgi:predicted nuclease of restriction endonuclease-like (RecB) superfamily